MSAKELLRSVREAENKYRISKELAERSRYKLAYRGQEISGADKSPVSRDNTYENNLVNMIDLDERAKKDKTAFLRLRTEVIDIINSLDDLKEREILISRYIYYEDWNRIAEKMNYSPRRIFYIHGNALKNFSKVCSKVQ